MSSPRAWSLLTIDGMRQYGGNAGYEDDPSAVYRYDSNVSNYRQVSEGDVIVLRSRIKILGIARIEEILTGEGDKQRLRCPVCGISQIKERVTMQPRWACRDHHAFDAPKRETVSVKTFEAHYGGTFRPAPRALTLQQLNDAVMRPSDQMSIKELNLAKFEEVLLDDIGCRRLVVEYADAIVPDTEQIDTDVDMPRSIIEARRRVLREVNLRRGQPQFRNRLILRYGTPAR